MKLKDKIISSILYWVVTAYASTWRYKFVNKENYDNMKSLGKKPVMAIWHDQLLPCTFIHRNEGAVAIASDSKDGDLIAFALNKWGYRTARGSSTRGGVKAALKAIKLSREHSVPCAVTVDGPKGPRHEVKQGAVFIAKNLDKAIIVTLVHFKHFKRFASWDKFLLPMPFSKITITYSKPIYISEKISEESISADRDLLQKTMTELTSEASPLFI